MSKKLNSHLDNDRDDDISMQLTYGYRLLHFEHYTRVIEIFYETCDNLLTTIIYLQVIIICSHHDYNAEWSYAWYNNQ